MFFLFKRTWLVLSFVQLSFFGQHKRPSGFIMSDDNDHDEGPQAKQIRFRMEALQEEMTALRKLMGTHNPANPEDDANPTMGHGNPEDEGNVLPPRGMVQPVRKIPVNLQEKIWAFQYVDLVQLLPQERAPDMPLTLFKTTADDTDTVVFQPRKPTKTIDCFNTWFKAFSIYAAVLTVKWPNRVPELFVYQTIINKHSKIHPWEKIYGYDQSFRWEVQDNVEKSWALLDQELILDEVFSSTMALVEKEKERTKSNNFPFVKREICRNFNSAKCRFGSKCKYLHKCNKCKKFGHGYVDCRLVKSRKSNNPSSPSNK